MRSILAIVLLTCFSFLANGQANYSMAAGIKFGWGGGITGKYALYNDDMIEGLVNFRSRRSLGFRYSIFSITALYERYEDLSEVTPGLTWFYGAGPHIGFLGGDYALADSDFSSLFLGVTGIVGLDYAFNDIPLNLSIDWAPRINIITGGQGFFDGAGGFLSARYIIE